jgi:hypothetical protein
MGERQPSPFALAHDECFGGLTLRIERVELLL